VIGALGMRLARELANAVDEYHEAADGISGDVEHDAANAMADAALALVEYVNTESGDATPKADPR
jgi:hypothetical protein